MRAYAQKTFELAVVEDGVCYRDMLEGMIERTRNPQKLAEYEAELALPPLPDALVYLWNAFCRLSARRSSGGFAIEALSFCEIEAFVRLSGLRLRPWEIRILEDLDDIFRSVHGRKS